MVGAGVPKQPLLEAAVAGPPSSLLPNFERSGEAQCGDFCSDGNEEKADDDQCATKPVSLSLSVSI